MRQATDRDSSFINNIQQKKFPFGENDFPGLENETNSKMCRNFVAFESQNSHQTGDVLSTNDENVTRSFR
jgi:hypothetical protein